jgi:hypothetical protein
MKRRIFTGCMLALITLFSASAMAKREVTRQLGGACGEDSSIVATCAAGLECKAGSCAMGSFLSGEVVDCRGQMQKAGIDTKKDFVAVFGGLCYMDNKCSGLYNAQIRAQDLQARAAETEFLSRNLAMSSIDPSEMQEFTSMSQEDKQALVDQAIAANKRVQEICDACSPYCVR